ncbi:MAG: CehA/McbA family metallohydrolase [Actinomycetota bacterium]
MLKISKRRVMISAAALATCAVVVASLPATAEKKFGRRDDKHGGVWLAGDLHVHSTYSHDSYGGPHDDNTSIDEFYTLGWSVAEQGEIARSRGLDYLAITDHNDVRSVADPAFGSAGLLWLPGYENSLAGHAQMLGSTELHDNGTRSLQDVERLARELKQLGGAFQINHPSDHDWERSYGYAFVPETIEVWNIGPWLWQHPMPAANDNDFSLRFWDAFLDAGHEVGATGGSDNHWRSITPLAGVGQPTTWVFAREASPEGVLEALREGRTTIVHQPPSMSETFINMEADRNRNGEFESMIGDKVPSGAAVKVTVEGAPGTLLRLVTNGSRTFELVEVTGNDFTYTTEAPAGSTWLRAEVFMPDAPEQRGQLSFGCDAIDVFSGPAGGEPTTLCENRLTMLALTSPIYISQD